MKTKGKSVKRKLLYECDNNSQSESSSKKPKANNTEPNEGNSVIFLNDAAAKIPSIGGFMDTQPTREQHIVSKPCDFAPDNGEKDVYTPNTSNANATDTAYLCSEDVITELGINDDPTRCTSFDNANNICGC
nr:hypothetical protein [Tanacetum cinerariifolium]